MVHEKVKRLTEVAEGHAKSSVKGALEAIRAKNVAKIVSASDKAAKEYLERCFIASRDCKYSIEVAKFQVNRLVDTLVIEACKSKATLSRVSIIRKILKNTEEYMIKTGC